jgi:hypothetical protein
MPSVVFVAIGLALGRYGANIVGGSALAALEPVTATALAVLGAFVGLEIGGRHEPRWPVVVLASAVELLTTVGIVAGGLLAFIASWHLTIHLETATFVLLMAASTAATAGIRVRADVDTAMRRAAAVADTDDVPLTALGAILIAFLGGEHVGMRVVVTAAVALVVGAATALLLREGRREWERPVLIAGGLLLVGGAATYAGTSPLLSGCILGIVWTRTDPRVREAADVELRRFQHPLVALLLAIAGASFTWTRTLPWVAAALLLLRFTGKISGGALAAPIVGTEAAAMATVLVPPGVLGLALALNAQEVMVGSDPLVVAAPMLVMILSEFVALPLLIGEPT